jgi:hypothetical protein
MGEPSLNKKSKPEVRINPEPIIMMRADSMQRSEIPLPLRERAKGEG